MEGELWLRKQALWRERWPGLEGGRAGLCPQRGPVGCSRSRADTHRQGLHHAEELGPGRGRHPSDGIAPGDAFDADRLCGD